METEVWSRAELVEQVERYRSLNKGKVYAPIPLAGFEQTAAVHGHDRFEAIAAALPAGARSALDIGAHWGYFAHRLEERGLQVVAVENSRHYLPFLRAIRQHGGKSFRVWEGSVFELPERRFDLVLALNIFHHFLKTETELERLCHFLRELSIGTMFFQAHNPGEGQMAGSHRNLEPDAFAEFVAEQLGGAQVERLAQFGSRPLYRITVD